MTNTKDFYVYPPLNTYYVDLQVLILAQDSKEVEEIIKDEYKSRKLEIEIDREQIQKLVAKPENGVAILSTRPLL